MKYNRNYYVPCVVHSKPYLIGFLDNLNMLEDVISFDENILDSVRFTDWLPDGSQRKDLTPEQIKEVMKQHQESLNLKENENEESDERNYFQVSCSCGNFYSFQHPISIPSENLKCGICDKILVDYTGHYEFEYDYSGTLEKMAVENEKGNSEEDDETED